MVKVKRPTVDKDDRETGGLGEKTEYWPWFIENVSQQLV